MVIFTIILMVSFLNNVYGQNLQPVAPVYGPTPPEVSPCTDACMEICMRVNVATEDICKESCKPLCKQLQSLLIAMSKMSPPPPTEPPKTN